MKVLLAVDGSDYTRRMLAYLDAHPELLSGNVEFTALTVNWPVPTGPRTRLTNQVIQEYYDSQAADALDPVVEFAKQKGWTLSTLARIGHPGEAIAEVAASDGYDLIVMGSHGRSALVNMVVGSVVTRVLALTRTAVLIVR